MKNFYIIGNMGSGKTTLAKKIAKKLNISNLDLDTIFWKGPYKNKQINPLRGIELEKFLAQNNDWVIEGVYKTIMTYLLKKQPHFIYIDLPWEENLKNLEKRGTSQDRIDYAKTYFDKDRRVQGSPIYNRNSHLDTFHDYKGKKTLLTSKKDIEEFLNSL